MRRLLILLLVFLMLPACAAPAEVTEEPAAPPPQETPADPAPVETSPEAPAEPLPPGHFVLSTQEAPLADGRTLRLEAVGKKTDDSFYGVREIRVFDGDQLLQTVRAWEAVEAEWSEGMAEEADYYTTCWAPEETMEALDLNFDGNTDFGLFGWPANNTIPYYYWMWDAETEQYQYAFILQGVSADSEKQELKSTFRLSAVEYETDYYQPDETGALYLARTEIDNWETGGLEDRAARETWVPAPDQRFGPDTSGWCYHDLTLVRRELPVQEIHDGGAVSNYTEIWEFKDGEFQMTSREEYADENEP